MSTTKNNQKTRDRLFAENPFCPQCGVKMIHPKDLPQHTPGKIKYFPDNTLTYEHTRSRTNPDRGVQTSGERVNGILCRKCNNEKGHYDMFKNLGIDEIRRRANRLGKE